jgi:hypothetical protein
MMRKAMLSWLVVGLAGCGSRVYTVPVQEAQRASRTLERGERTSVLALDEGGWPVPIEIRSSDQFEVITKASSAQPAWLGAGQLGQVDESIEHLKLYHRNPGTSLVAIGGGMLGGVTFVNVLAAAGTNRPLYIIPLVGPGLMMHHSLEDLRKCEAGYDTDCGGHRIAMVFALLDLLAQAAGTGLMIAGAATWESGRELDVRDRDGQSLLRLSVEPVMLGEGGMGGAVMGRF